MAQNLSKDMLKEIHGANIGRTKNGKDYYWTAEALKKWENGVPITQVIKQRQYGWYIAMGMDIDTSLIRRKRDGKIIGVSYLENGERSEGYFNDMYFMSDEEQNAFWDCFDNYSHKQTYIDTDREHMIT